MSCILQLASCVHVCCSYSWASCMQTITEAIFYIPKKNRSRNFVFPGRLFKFPGRIALRPPCILRVVIYLYFSWILLLVHTQKKNLPIPDVTLKNRGSEMIGIKSKNRPINWDRRSDLAALVGETLFWRCRGNYIFVGIYQNIVSSEPEGHFITIQWSVEN